MTQSLRSVSRPFLPLPCTIVWKFFSPAHIACRSQNVIFRYHVYTLIMHFWASISFRFFTFFTISPSLLVKYVRAAATSSVMRHHKTVKTQLVKVTRTHYRWIIVLSKERFFLTAGDCPIPQGIENVCLPSTAKLNTRYSSQAWTSLHTVKKNCVTV